VSGATASEQLTSAVLKTESNRLFAGDSAARRKALLYLGMVAGIAGAPAMQHRRRSLEGEAGIGTTGA
jgi:hypothetical protein